jgi:hypothetical protein
VACIIGRKKCTSSIFNETCYNATPFEYFLCKTYAPD